MHNPNEWKAGPDGSVVAGADTICRDAAPGDRALILAAPQMYQFLYATAHGNSCQAERARQLIAVAEDRAPASALLPY